VPGERHERALRIGRRAAEAGRERQREHADDHEARALRGETAAAEPADKRAATRAARERGRAPSSRERGHELAAQPP
jgi:hypothetical protein